MKHLLIITLLCFISFNLFAQNKVLKDVAETQEMSKKIVQLFKEDKISKLFSEMKPYWPMPQNEMDVTEQKTISQLNLIKDRFGKAFGYTKVKNEVIGDFAIRETYIVQYENSAIRVILTYYKNESGWIINAFKWDDSFPLEFR
ncbi:hypothetical protein [Cytophaga aurantiaca]|uniref:hypothetical protein n=1 Tax=Cytophaga aurantiaca TaxID=29530 RepID=UPI0012FC61B5|nr:hypothetical protein [Cytophaga aurantiaca]